MGIKSGAKTDLTWAGVAVVRFFIILWMMASLLAAWPVPAAADSPPPIQVVSQSVESHFPDDLTFTITARSDAARSDAGDIVDAALYYRVGWEKAERVGLPEPFAPSPEVTLTHVWRTGGETVPPFIEISYYWRIVDRAGNDFTTELTWDEYADETHDWQSLSNDQVVVYWYERPAAFGQELFEAAVESYEHVAAITGVVTERPARVVIYNNHDDFCAFFAPRSCQDWIGGQAHAGLTVQWGMNRYWLTHDVIPHELAHVFYNQIFRNTWVRVPTWFNEGLAVYNERTGHRYEKALVEMAAAEGNLIPLRKMGTQASGLAHDSIGLWYAQAYSLVAFIAEVYGEDVLGDVVLTLADNHPMEEALQRTLDMDLIAFEMAWLEWLGYPVDSIPTPIRVPPMTVVPLVLPTAPRGQPAATVTPAPSPTSTLTPAPVIASPTPSPPISTPPARTSPPCSCCCSSAGLLILLVVWLMWRS